MLKTYNLPTNKQLRALCDRPMLNQRALGNTIETIYTEIDKKGDQALIDYTKQFDGVTIRTLAVPQKSLQQWAAQTPPKLRAAIDKAAKNIRCFHEAQILKSVTIRTTSGVICWQEARPIERVGLYIPGGSAPLVSTVLMLGIPAQLAKCKETIICTPPNKEGNVDPAICYAAQAVGATKLIMAGGAQAIAALAQGTASIPKVDKIFGPGNQYVIAAKQYAQRYGVAIDLPAGPSEVMVIADDSSQPAFVAADLLSQAEHGQDSQVVLAVTSASMAFQVSAQLKKQQLKLPRRAITEQALQNSFCIILKSIEAAMDFANMYAPEHLILSIRQPKRYIARVINAGSVFLGAFSPESAGDYASGTNHTLPTNGWARSCGGVSIDSFVKKVTFQTLTKQGLANLASTIETLAQAEGLEAHARAVSIRLQ